MAWCFDLSGFADAAKGSSSLLILAIENGVATRTEALSS